MNGADIGLCFAIAFCVWGYLMLRLWECRRYELELDLQRMGPMLADLTALTDDIGEVEVGRESAMNTFAAAWEGEK